MRILLIEDETRIQAFVRRGLEAEGYGVVTADDGWTACRCALGRVGPRRPRPPPAGDERPRVLQELHRERPDLPVVVLSARGDLRTKLKGFELGATDYVSKPFALDELLARIRVQLRRTVPPAKTSSRSTPGACCSIWRAARRASARRHRSLRPRVPPAAPLLLHVGEVMSRERLLAEVWGYTSTRARTSSRSAYAGCGRSSVPMRTSKRFVMRATAWLA